MIPSSLINAGGGSAATSGTMPTSLPKTGMLAEYRFDEGTGTVVTDYSGNGNTGAYVGSPTFVGGGGFLSANGKYATGVAGAITGCQTFYIAFDMDADGAATLHTVLGNSAGQTNLNINTRLSYPASASPLISCVETNVGGTADTVTTTAIPGSATILAVLMDSAGVQATRIFINGVECAYNSQTVTEFAHIAGAPWFGASSGVANAHLNSNIYYFASYSTYQTAAQIASNSQIIRNIMLARGNVQPGISVNATLAQGEILCIGNSLTNGYGGVTPYSQDLNPVQQMNINNRGWSSQTAFNLQYAVPGFCQSLYSNLGQPNIACIWAASNDLEVNNYPPNQVWEFITVLCSQARAAGYKIVLFTEVARSQSSNNQLRLDAYNSLCRQNWRQFADEFADIAADPVLGASGANSSATWFQGDNIHLTTLGQARVAVYANAAINRLLTTPASFIGRYSQVGNVSVTNTASETSIVGGSAFLNNQAWNTRTLNCVTNSTTTVTLPFYYGSDLVVGQTVTGSGIPPNTTISAIPQTYQITLNNAATTSLSSVNLTFGNIPVKGGFWTPGKAIKVESEGLLSSGSAQTLNRKFKIGGVTFASTGAVTLPSSLSAVDVRMELTVTCVTIGSSANGGTNGTFWVQGALIVETAAGVVTRYSMTNASVASLDTTADALIDVTDTWGGASASNIDNTTNLTIWQVAP